MSMTMVRLPVTGLVLLAAACVAEPIREVSEPPQYEGQTAIAAPATAPAPPPGTAPSRSTEAPQRVIDENYPAQGKIIDVASATGPRDLGTAGDITLDFEDADVRDVIRAVLGDVLMTNFVIDPDVSGRVTLSTDRPLARKSLLATLEAVLATQGARLIAYDNLYRITRSSNPPALAGGGIDVQTSARQRGASYRIFPLAFIAAQEMQTILEPLMPDGAIVHTDTKRNILIAAGTGPVLKLAADTVGIFDVNQMRGQTVHLVGLRNAGAEAVSGELEILFASGAKAADAASQVQFIPITRLNAIMIISRQPAYVEDAAKWISRLDRSRQPNQRRVYVYYVQHGRASSLADALRGVFGGAGGAGAIPLAQPAAAVGEPVPTPAYEAGARQLEGPSPGPADILGPNLRITVDEDRNALLISATPKEFQMVEQVLATLDIEPLQVMIETSILEVVLRDELRYGIQYAISNGGLGIAEDGDLTLTRGLTVATTPEGIVTPIISALLPGFSFTLEGSSRTRLVIDLLSALTEVNLLSSPNVVVLNNQVANLRVGDEVPIVTQTTTSVVTDNPLIVNSVQYRSTGVNLEVTPRVNASGMVTLEIVQEVSNVVVTTTSNIDSPTIQNRFLLTTVSLRSGETVMLGGLIREEATDSDLGIPILHQLPFIGALFGQKNTTTERTELVLLIRPVVIASPEDARTVTDNMRSKFLVLLERERSAIRQPRQIMKEDTL